MLESKNKTELKSFDMYQEDGRYYFKAVYRSENEHNIRETIFPKIPIHIRKDTFVISSPETLFYDNRRFVDLAPSVDLGFGPIRLDQDKEGNHYYVKVIEEKVHELTMDEIEKKLGYKVKIVNKKK